jgi:hypothetical protein
MFFQIVPLLVLAIAVPALSVGPHFNAGLLTKHRPPIQVQEQSGVQNTVAGAAQGLSDNSREQMITDVLQAAQKSPKLDPNHPIKVKNLNRDDLFSWFEWEFQRLPIIHNGPIFDKGDTPYKLDDTDVFTTMNNGYIQNIIHRWVLGREDKDNYYGQSNIMQKYLKYPAFSNMMSPTLQESNQRPVYCANNWDKKHCGNFEYGKVTYVINPKYADKYFFLPFDSGKYAASASASYCNGGICMGTKDDFSHVVLQHKKTYGDYDLATIFNRWYDPAHNSPSSLADLKYFEVEFRYEVMRTKARTLILINTAIHACTHALMHSCTHTLSATAWLPEALLYVTVKYWDLFATDNGQWIRDWMKDNKRPLVWADDDTSGMLLDPYVGNYLPYQADSNFKAKWDNGGPAKGDKFDDLFRSCGNQIKLDFREYFNKRACSDQEEKDTTKMILGQNFDQACVYNTYNSPVPVAPTPVPPGPAPSPQPTGLENQQFFGPDATTKWAIILKASCDSSGQNCNKLLTLSHPPPTPPSPHSPPHNTPLTTTTSRRVATPVARTAKSASMCMVGSRKKMAL